MRIAIAQLDPVIGAFEQNVQKIKEAYERACQAQARLLLTPELGVCGYPPHDLTERPEMFERCAKAIAELTAITKGKKCALAVGHIVPNPDSQGRAAQNVASILEGGKEVFRQAKTLLPTYDVFDEARYFEPARENKLWNCDGTKVALAICEDLWAKDPMLGRTLYGRDPMDAYCEEGAQLLISLSASPYEWNKWQRREKLHADSAAKLKAPMVYVNQVCANDEILFDGGSFASDAQGKVLGRLPLFKTGFGLIDTATGQWDDAYTPEREDKDPEEIEVVARGLVMGLRDYFQRTGFKQAVLGLSGGIDSAVVAVLAAKALGPQNVLGVGMPSQYSSAGSLADAEALAKNLGVNFEVRPIKFLFSTANREIGQPRGELAPLAQENLQSRLRGIILMALSNHYNALVLTTGNKSEMAMGYCTMYGDMCGAINPIGDLFKTRVYELARYINRAWGAPIPESSITKAPSAELRPDQKDQDTLPPYEALDAMLADYVENGIGLAELETKYAHTPGTSGPDWVRKTLRMLEINEYKRRQACPVLKISTKAFGIGRRIPIAKRWGF
jgi:NAD+ synthetase